MSSCYPYEWAHWHAGTWARFGHLATSRDALAEAIELWLGSEVFS